MNKLFLVSALTLTALMTATFTYSQDRGKVKTSKAKSEIKQEGRDIKKGVKSLGPAVKDAARGTKDGVKKAGQETKRVTREMKNDLKKDFGKKNTK